MAGGLHLASKIGPLGQLYDAAFRTDLPVPDRFEKVLDFVAGHGFPVYGIPTRTHIHRTHLHALATCASKAGVELHYVAMSGHPLDSPIFLLGPHFHSTIAIEARRLENAALGGMKSYTMFPPKAVACRLDQFESQVGMILDEAGRTVPLRICNAPSQEYNLSSLEDLLDFCRRTGTQPTIAVANAFLATGKEQDVDTWKSILAKLQAPAVITFGNYRIRPGMPPLLTIYDGDDRSTPRIAPVLEAAMACNLDARVLVYGDRPEADALGVLRLQAELEGADLTSQGLRHTRSHRRVATFSEPE
jgi:hypothetical protein